MADEPMGERVAVLETEMAALKGQLGAMNDKLDSLVAAFNMGRGGAVMIAKIGGLLVLAAGAIAWVADHWHGWFK